VVEMRSVIGGWSFLTKRGSKGRELRTDRKHEIPGRDYEEHWTCQFDYLESIQLFEDVVNKWNNWGASGR